MNIEQRQKLDKELAEFKLKLKSESDRQKLEDCLNTYLEFAAAVEERIDFLDSVYEIKQFYN